MKTNKNQKQTLITIGDNIRKYRLEKGCSQEELAFECELHRTYIGAVERGERNIGGHGDRKCVPFLIN